MTDCVFCKIIASEIPSHKVYEDDSTFAFLDIHPINPGHMLVIPKKHVPDFYRLEEVDYQNLFTTVKRLSAMVDTAMHPKKVGLIVAGWDVPHAHIHVVPMWNYHDITSKSALEGNRANPSDEELKEIADVLRDSL